MYISKDEFLFQNIKETLSCYRSIYESWKHNYSFYAVASYIQIIPGSLLHSHRHNLSCNALCSFFIRYSPLLVIRSFHIVLIDQLIFLLIWDFETENLHLSNTFCLGTTSASWQATGSRVRDYLAKAGLQ